MTSSRFRTKSPSFSVQNARFVLIRGAVFLSFFALATRLVYVQAFLRSDLKIRADKQVRSTDDFMTPRFRILDRNNQVLAEMVSVDSCYVDPVMLKDKEGTAKFLAKELDLNEKELVKSIRTAKGSFYWVKRNISPEASNAIHAQKILGVALRKEWRRHYPQGPLASHVLGFVGVDGAGLSGIEHQYDAVLNRRRTSDKSGKQKQLLGDVQLTLDASIQKIAERELDWGVSQTKAKRGTVIVQNPSSGEILASASWPPLSLSPERPPHPQELRVPTIIDVFEPGSTFKIVTVGAAIEEKAVSLTEKFFGEKGSWKVMDITLHDHEPEGWMTLQDILTKSSNIGSAKVGERLGSERLYQYARQFGFGVFPGSGLNGEAKGVLRPVKKWSGVSKYVVAFGQEVGVTALQIANAYSAVANGGELMEPRFVKSIIGDDGIPCWENSFAKVRRVFSKETALTLTAMLRNVVTQGTGQNAQIRFMENQKVAGKTGTAQKYDFRTHGYSTDLTLVSFCGYFPADAPKYTILVILDEPEGRRWGGTDAAPIFRRIAEELVPKEVS